MNSTSSKITILAASLGDRLLLRSIPRFNPGSTYQMTASQGLSAVSTLSKDLTVAFKTAYNSCDTTTGDLETWIKTDITTYNRLSLFPGFELEVKLVRSQAEVDAETERIISEHTAGH